MMHTSTRYRQYFDFAIRLFSGKNPHTINRVPLVLISSLYFSIILNTTFFKETIAIYPLQGSNFLFLTALFVTVFCAIALVFNLISIRFLTKPILVALLIVCSLSNYFMGTYGILMDTEMLTNIIETNPSESLDLASPMLFLHLLFLGVLPSIFIYRTHIKYETFLKSILSRTVLSLIALMIIAVSLFSSAPTFASFFREHKSVRYFSNPIAFIYSATKLASAKSIQSNQPFVHIAEDAKVTQRTVSPRLIIFVVGETARADRFSLNGYARKTNPLLEQEDVISFTNVLSSGTSTSTSLPCMFSQSRAKGFNLNKAHQTENLLDVLAEVGVSVLWRDNNSGSKGVASRVTYQEFFDDSINPAIDGEPRDVGMLLGLQEYIDAQEGDLFIVLHQMGSHGPAYYKRYPKAFEVFQPVCESNQLEKCSSVEINNAYDNTILYTDYFLSQVISLLKKNESSYHTAMLYFSDHGESLGENNLYLHGYPYAFAPIEQKHVPAIFWFSDRFPIDKDTLKKRSDNPYSHDHIFHTTLGLFGVETKARIDDLAIVGLSDSSDEIIIEPFIPYQNEKYTYIPQSTRDQNSFTHPAPTAISQ